MNIVVLLQRFAPVMEMNLRDSWIQRSISSLMQKKVDSKHTDILDIDYIVILDL